MPSRSAKKRVKKAEKQHRLPAQPRTYRGRFGSLSSKNDESYGLELTLRSSSVDVSAVDNLQEDVGTTEEDKLERMKALYAKWKCEDELETVDGAALQVRQRIRVKEVGLIVFGFTLREEQIEAVWTLYSEQKDLLLLAKTGFGKSLIFQLLPFMSPVTGVVIVLMPLKLLQAEQCDMINSLPRGKGIVLNGENNQKTTQVSIASGNYTHVFTSPEIALSVNFKKRVLNHPGFTERLRLLAVDEIHLVDEWGKSFRPLYAEIEKVRKRIPHDVPLLGVSATLTAKARQRVLQKAGFSNNYRLMQTSLDRPEIMQIHRFMKHPRASCLDLQFILPETAMQAKDIQKTIIFVNSVTEIIPMIEILQDWMKKRGYPMHSSKWIRPYNATLSEWTKGITAKAFGMRQEDNTDCTILVATDAYGMGIDNPDVQLVVQWDIPKLFDSMIQRMGRAGRKGGQSTFVFFSPAWSKIDDLDEIQKRLASKSSAASAQAVNASRPSKTARPSPLSQIIEADGDVSDSESVAESVGESEVDEFDFDDVHDAGLMTSSLLATEFDEKQIEAKKKTHASRTNAEKRAKLEDEFFSYIHVAPCRRLFSLEWYDDLTYAPNHNGLKRPLPTCCCNGPSCLSPEPDFMLRESFITESSVKPTEADREWIACRFAALKKWRKKTAAAEWLEAEVGDEEMFDTFIMTDECLLSLATSGGSLNGPELVDFLQPFGVDEYAKDILICLQKNRPALNSDSSGFELPSKADRKDALKDFRASKKIKHLDDPVAAEEAAKTNERDQWASRIGRATPAAKARMIKIAKDEKKKLDKQEKRRGKGKSLAVETRRLALNNSHTQSQYGTFKAILSDPVVPDDLSVETATPDSHRPSAYETPPAPQANRVINSAKLNQKLTSNEKRKIAANTLAANRRRLQATQSTLRPATSPPSVAMELERPSSKRKARMTAKGVENTPSKRMRPSED